MTHSKEIFHKYKNTYWKELFGRVAQVCCNRGGVRDPVSLQAQTCRSDSSANPGWNAVNWWISGNAGAVIWLDVLQAGRAGNWTPKQTRRRGVNKCWGTAAIQLHQMPAPPFFFFLNLKLVVAWSASRGLHKHILCALLAHPGCCWSRLLVDLLFNFAAVFSVWTLQRTPLRTCRLFICFQSCSVDVAVGVRLWKQTVFYNVRRVFISLTCSQATEHETVVRDRMSWDFSRRV